MSCRLCGLMVISATFLIQSITIVAVPRFHLKNKSNKAIAVTLYKDSEAQQEFEHIQMQSVTDVISDKDTKVNQIKSIKISYCDDGGTRCADEPDGFIVVSFDISSIKPEDATYYISFYVDKHNMPVVELQKGKGLISSRKTADGYSLGNNVKKIKVIERFYTRDS